MRRPTAYLGKTTIWISSYREDITQGKTTITMNKTVTIPVDIGAIDGTLSFNRVSEDIIQPVMVKMKDRIETELASLCTRTCTGSLAPLAPRVRRSRPSLAAARS